MVLFVHSFMRRVLIHLQACVCVFTVAHWIIRDGQVFFWEVICSTASDLVHIPIFYTTQSTAGPGIDSVHKCRYQNHSQSTHADAPGVWTVGVWSIWQMHSREEKKRWVPFTCSAPWRLDSIILWILLYTEQVKCILRHNDSWSRCETVI